MFEKSKGGGTTEVVPGIHLKTLVYGEKSLMTQVRLEQGALIPPHSHPHEQTGYLISGQLEFVVGGKRIMTKPGDSWSIPGNVQHSATAIQETIVIEVFSPVREDYLLYYTKDE